MAQPIYSTSQVIDLFKGINQTGDGTNLSMRFCVESENVNFHNGSFSPMREGDMIEQTLEGPIGTLAYLSRRYGENAGTTVLVAISEGKLFTKLLDYDDPWQEQYDGLTVNDCDWVTYEYNPVGGENTAGPVDVLLFTNAKDGMFCLFGDTLDVIPVPTPKKFGVLARYNERIWGSGIEEDPDMMVYSAPYDPFDWTANDEIPEDGAGDIMQPTWDGDSFLSLRQFGSDLLSIKRNSIWRIYGTNPGEFVMTRQYGGGTIQENTVAVYNEYAYMLGEHGLMRYDGTGCYPYLQDAVQKLMGEKVNHDALHKACAGMRNGIYCIALPINGSNYCNAILEYNVNENFFQLRTEVSVDSFMQYNERLFYTSESYPGVVYELRDDKGTVKNCKWISGYQDLGQKNSIKSAFILYAMVESEAPVELRLGIRTEKKLKQKIVNTKPGKMLRLHLNTQGREFRLEMTSYSAVPFTIAGGIKLDLELDPD